MTTKRLLAIVGVAAALTSSACSSDDAESAKAPAAPTTTRFVITALPSKDVCGLYSKEILDTAFGVTVGEGAPTEATSSCKVPFEAADGSAQSFEIVDVANEVSGFGGEEAIDVYVTALGGTAVPFTGISSGSVVTLDDGRVAGLVVFDQRVIRFTTTDTAVEAAFAKGLAKLPAA